MASYKGVLSKVISLYYALRNKSRESDIILGGEEITVNEPSAS